MLSIPPGGEIPPSLQGRSVLGLSDCCHEVTFKAVAEVSCRQEKHIVPIRDFNDTGSFNPP